MMARHLPRQDYALMKAAFRKLVGALSGRGAAEVTRVGQQTLSDYGNAGNPRYAEVFPPIDVVADLEAELGDYPVTRVLAELNNCLLVPMPDTRHGGALLDLTGKSAREIGALTQEIIEAVADGKVTLNEGQPICAHIREIATLLLALGEQVKAEAGKENS